MLEPANIILTDDLGVEHSFAGPPSRLVSLVPSLTETVVKLDAGEKLAGITDYCIHPASELAGLPRVGGTKDPDLGRILALNPDLIIANKDENRKPDIEKLAREVPVFVTHPVTVRDSIKTVWALAALTTRVGAAAAFSSACIELLQLMGDDPTVNRPLRTACLIWRDPWMAVGGDTYSDDILKTAGFKNVFGPADGRYPQTSLEEIFERSPEVILLPDEPYEFGEADVNDILAHPTRNPSLAAAIPVNGEAVTWFGYRTLDALEYLWDVRRKLG